MQERMKTKGGVAGWLARGLVAAACLAPAAVRADFELAMPFDFSAVFITRYVGTEAFVDIPETIDGRPVTQITQGAFAGITNLVTVTVPAGVTNVGNAAFASNVNLQAVYFRGNAPVAGSGMFSGTTATVYYQTNTTGWTSTYAGRPALPYQPPVLTVEPASRSVGPGAGATTFSVLNTGGGFLAYETAESNDWLEISSSGGATFTVAYSNNAGSTVRTGRVTVTAGGVEGSPRTVTIVQDFQPVLTRRPASTNLSCLASAGRQVQVGGNQAWTAVSSAAWLVITSGASGSGAGVITYRVEENPGAARTGYITITGGGITHRCFVNQAASGPAIELDPGSRTHAFGAASGQVVAVAANVAWAAVPSAEWLEITSGGTGSGVPPLTDQPVSSSSACQSSSWPAHWCRWRVRHPLATTMTAMGRRIWRCTTGPRKPSSCRGARMDP